MVKELAINLTEEQMQIVRKVVDVKCDTLVIPVDRAKVVLYGIIADNRSVEKVRRIQLTDAQKKQIREVAEVECDFIELDPTDQSIPIILYRIIPSPDRLRAG